MNAVKSMTDGGKPTAGQIHIADQNWALAQTALDQFVAQLRSERQNVAEYTGLSDDAAIFDFVLAALQVANAVEPGAIARTTVMAAAAITRLARAPGAKDELAQYETEMENPDDNH
jgi:hypothetical protein